MRAVRARRNGGSDVLVEEEIDPPEPGRSQVLVQVAASGVNYIDVYHREGLFPIPVPFTLGVEGSGRVADVGAEVDSVSVGDRVACKEGRGSYAGHVVVAESELVPIPAGIGDDVAAAAMLQGLTAHYLSRSAYPVQSGDTAVMHAAAGGVFLLLTQMIKLRDGLVIATVSTEEKARTARAAGADHVVRYDDQDFASAVRALTGGDGAAVVYDGVGQATFEGSLSACGCVVPSCSTALRADRCRPSTFSAWPSPGRCPSPAPTSRISPAIAAS